MQIWTSFGAIIIYKENSLADVKTQHCLGFTESKLRHVWDELETPVTTLPRFWEEIYHKVLKIWTKGLWAATHARKQNLCKRFETIWRMKKSQPLKYWVKCLNGSVIVNKILMKPQILLQSLKTKAVVWIKNRTSANKPQSPSVKALQISSFKVFFFSFSFFSLFLGHYFFSVTLSAQQLRLLGGDELPGIIQPLVPNLLSQE